MLQVPVEGADGALDRLVDVETAGFGRRLAALAIDWVVAGLSAVALARVSFPPENPLENLIITGFYVVEVGVLVGLVGFSIGKRVLGLRVETPAGRPPAVPQALFRSLLVCLIIPPLVQNADGRGLQDVLTGTRQIKI